MKPYYAETKVRWSDMDPNRHLANSAYMNFTSFARIEYLRKIGITIEDMARLDIGPAVLREEISFFHEGHEGQEIMISVVISGNSEDGQIFEFEHNLYDKKTGKHLAYSRVFGLWFSRTNRKRMTPPAEINDKIKARLDPENLKILSMKDLKSLPVFPNNIDPKIFENA
ncbi:MAG: thioesterase family protein [Weeksellaceae bacterium]